MVTAQKINALSEERVLECVSEQGGEALRVVVYHTSPSHYAAAAQVRDRAAKTHHPFSGPMTADQLVKWLEILVAKWATGQTPSWAAHELDEKTRQFIHRIEHTGAKG